MTNHVSFFHCKNAPYKSKSKYLPVKYIQMNANDLLIFRLVKFLIEFHVRNSFVSLMCFRFKTPERKENNI